MAWAKGQSGNPGGRPAQPFNLKKHFTITQLARKHAPTAVRALVQIMKSPKSSSTARAIAADKILDRAYGKAPQAIAVVASGGPTKMASLSDQELEQIIAGTFMPPVETDSDIKTIEGEMLVSEIEQHEETQRLIGVHALDDEQVEEDDAAADQLLSWKDARCG